MRLRDMPQIIEALENFNVFRTMRDRICELELFEHLLPGELINDILEAVENKDTNTLLNLRIKIAEELSLFMKGSIIEKVTPKEEPKKPAKPKLVKPRKQSKTKKEKKNVSSRRKDGNG